jgi:hypothetical protein
MKKLYTILALSILSFGAYAQCTINSSVFTGPTDYGIVPDTIQNLPAATVGVPYVTDIQFHVSSDTTVTSPLPATFPFINVTIDSIVGIPANFTYNMNPSNGVFPGGSYGCAGLTGTAQPGQENGGPQGNGVYPIVIYATANVDVFTVPTPFPTTFTGYNLVIQGANSVPAMSNVNFTVSQNAPNPADKSTEFLINNPNTGNVQFTLYNILGETVRQVNIYALKGETRYTLNTNDLEAGVYLYTFRSGNSVITRRMTVSH